MNAATTLVRQISSHGQGMRQNKVSNKKGESEKWSARLCSFVCFYHMFLILLLLACQHNVAKSNVSLNEHDLIDGFLHLCICMLFCLRVAALNVSGSACSCIECDMLMTDVNLRPKSRT